MNRIQAKWLFLLLAIAVSLIFVQPSAYADAYLSAAPAALSWAPNPESDVQGYEIFRSNSSDGSYVRISSEIIPETSWQDWNISAGNTYYYKLCAVDTSGNSSPLSTPSEAVIVSNGDYDDDGFSDSFEQAMGSSPYDGASRPIAAVLVLNPEHSLFRVGATRAFSVLGVFETLAGEVVERDMTCSVEYHSNPPGIVSVNACGAAVCQAEGTADVWAWQVVNGQTLAASNQATIIVDGSPPYVNQFENQPYNGQGINEDINGNGLLDPGENIDGDAVLDNDAGPTPRVPVDSGILMRVADAAVGENIGIDQQSIQLLVNGTVVPVKVRPVVPGDFHELDIVWNNALGFAYNEVVIAELSLSDIAGNALYFRESFKVESAEQHGWAVEHRPNQTLADTGDGRCEITITPLPDSINDEALGSAKLIFNCNEPVQPRFGPVDELPPVDIAAPSGIPISIEPVALFDSPITVVLPTPDANPSDSDGDGVLDAGLEEYSIYQYMGNPSVQWREASETSGWVLDGSRIDLYNSVAPAIRLLVSRSSGIQAAKPSVPLPPVADVKINGQDGPLTLTTNDPASVTVAFNPVEGFGQVVDWWLIADTPKGRYFYRNDKRKWVERLHASGQARIAETPPTEMFGGLPPFGPGDYSICFGVDKDADGRPDLDWQDTVDVHVRN
jgi:hypothetical protein